ncbi:MAG: hypothetical protein N2507_05250 [Candidatus Bipolaricaulota bacterium]|nr:hypothetical protein [Candidatus Bipolaricaulota bacterium]MCX7844715.1 hypothetical protein [Candidatus Bipolaricaulota bacterium]MDW8152428.1 hypothetical protein [Candidatus Bipolaricaulota bacterium]
MRAVWAVVVGGVALAAPPALLWEGKLSWALPAGPLSWEASLSWAWEAWGWRWEPKARFVDGIWREFKFLGTGRFGEFVLSPGVDFDPRGPRFLSLTLPVKGAIWGLRLEGVARMEDKGIGWGLTFFGPAGSLLERLRLRFNLKRFLDEVLEEDWRPSLSLVEAMWSVPLAGCEERVRGWLVFTKEGFSELGASFSLRLPRELGLTLFSVTRFKTEEKRVFLSHGFVYQLPACVEAYLGVDWNPTTWSIEGIKVYALGLRCEADGLSLRFLASFEPIGLVKEPYGQGLWLGWEGAGPCGPVKFCLALYFGDVGLWGVGEVEAAVEFDLGPGSLSLNTQVKTGEVRSGLGWKVSI